MRKCSTCIPMGKNEEEDYGDSLDLGKQLKRDKKREETEEEQRKLRERAEDEDDEEER